MKRIYKTLASTRMLLATLMFTVIASTANAEESYYWYHTHAQSYPTGGGKVYLSSEETPEADRQYAAESEDFTVKHQYGMGSANTYIYAYAQPEEGFIFLGWKELSQDYWQDLQEEPNIDIRDYMSPDYISQEPEAYFYVNTTVSTPTNTENAYSVMPDNSVVALFGHINVKHITGQTELGTFSIEDETSDIGDFTTITATPAAGAEFLYWLDDEGNKYDKNPLEVEINRNITFYPMFSAPDYITIDFGEGSYKVFGYPDAGIDYDYDYHHHVYITPYDESIWSQGIGKEGYYVTVDVEVDTVINGVDTMVIEQRQMIDSIAIFEDYHIKNSDNSLPTLGYITDINNGIYGSHAGDAVLLYGKGLSTIYVDHDTYVSSRSAYSYFKPAANEGTDIAALPQDGTKYYIFDEATLTFNAVTEGIVPAGSAYLALPADVAKGQPDVIHFIENEKYRNVEYTAYLPTQYEEAPLNVDVDGILEQLGVSSLDEVNIYAVQSNGTLDPNYKLGETDGWRNAAGDWDLWGNFETSRFFVKADFTRAENQIYQVGCHYTDEPTTYVATYKFTQKGAEDNYVILTVTLKYENPNAPYAYEELNIAETINVDLQSEVGSFYEDMTATVDIKSILNTLGVSSIDDVDIYAVMAYDELDSDYMKGSTDGWRNMEGDWTGWQRAGVRYYVRADFSLDKNQITAAGGYPAGIHNTESITYSASYVLVVGTAEDNKAVEVKVNIIYGEGSQEEEDPTAIGSIVTAPAKSDEIYDITGRKVLAPTKGLYIIGGKKVLMK